MKFSTKVKEFVEHLKNAKSVISPNPALPIVECVKLSLVNHELEIVATNLEVISKQVMSVEPIQDGSVCVECKSLTGLLETLPSLYIIHVSTEDGSFKIESESGTYVLPCLSSEDYIDIPETPEKPLIEISVTDFVHFSTTPIYAASKDQLRQGLCGVFLENAQSFRAVCANGKYLCYDEPIESTYTDHGKFAHIIPPKALSYFAKNADKDEDLTILHANGWLHIVSESLEVITRCIDDKFPDYRNVLVNPNNQISIDKNVLLAILKRCGVLIDDFDNEYKVLHIQVMGDKVIFSCTNIEGTKRMEETLPIASKFESDFKINPMFMYEAVDNSNGSTINIGFVSKSNSIVIDSANSDYHLIASVNG